MPRPPWARSRPPCDLREELEDLRQHRRLDPHPGISDPDRDLAVAVLGYQDDRAARVGVLGGVVQQVAEDLFQSHGVGREGEGIRRELDGQLVAAILDQGTSGGHRPVDDPAEVDHFPAKLDFPTVDPGDVHQVLHQAAHGLDLALEHLEEPAIFQVVTFEGMAQEVHRVRDRDHRVAELVSQHRQELALAAVGVLELLVETRVLRGDGGSACEIFRDGQVGLAVGA